MTLIDMLHQLVVGIQNTSIIEYIAVFTGIASVWFSRKESILVYPVGLVSTIIFIYISAKGGLLGEASVNVYYTIMSFYGWYLWLKKDTTNRQTILHISYSSKRERLLQIVFFAICYFIIFSCLVWLKTSFAPNAVPWADAFASATAYTGMWLMAKKKVESWWWWIATDIVSIPLYFVKGYVFSSLQFFVFTILAIAGFIEWKRKAQTINNA